MTEPPDRAADPAAHRSDDVPESVGEQVDTASQVETDSDANDGDQREATFEPVSDPVATARRRHGTAGAILAAGLFGVDIALGRKPKEEIPVVVASNDEPTDVDADGITVAIDDTTSVVSPPLPRRDLRPATRRSARPRRR